MTASKYARKDRALSRYMAEGGSRSLAGAHAKELRTFAAARQFIACYAVPRALRAIESLRACIADVVKPVTPQRVLTADAADNAENAAQTAWLLNPCPSTTETYIRALNAEAAESLALARDLAASRWRAGLDADRRQCEPSEVYDREADRRGKLARALNLEEGE